MISSQHYLLNPLITDFGSSASGTSTNRFGGFSVTKHACHIAQNQTRRSADLCGGFAVLKITRLQTTAD